MEVERSTATNSRMFDPALTDVRAGEFAAVAVQSDDIPDTASKAPFSPSALLGAQESAQKHQPREAGPIHTA